MRQYEIKQQSILLKIKHGFELDENNEDAMIEAQPAQSFTISKNQTFSNFISLQLGKLNTVPLLSNP
jgi:hypothetical protein